MKGYLIILLAIIFMSCSFIEDSNEPTKCRELSVYYSQKAYNNVTEDSTKNHHIILPLGDIKIHFIRESSQFAYRKYRDESLGVYAYADSTNLEIYIKSKIVKGKLWYDRVALLHEVEELIYNSSDVNKIHFPDPHNQVALLK